MKKRFLPDFAGLLTADNATYANLVQQIWDWWIESDQFDQKNGDAIKPSVEVRMELVAREPGVFAGGEELELVLREVVSLHVDDGADFKEGDVLLELNGRMDELLLVERTIVNLVGRMSGIATKTKKLTSKLHNIKVAATRKTLWSLLDKKAVTVGGGLTHRLSYGQAMIVKDNDFEWLRSMVENSGLDDFFDKMKNLAFVEIEVENAEQVEVFKRFADEYFACTEKLPPLGIMFDNLKAHQFKQWLTELSEQVFREASGGITEENYLDYDVLGLDFISLGALTKNSYAIDLSLDLARK